MRAEVFRLELTKVLRQQPFEKFLIAFDSGDKVIIEHPENVAFDPTPGSSYHLYVVGINARCHSSLDLLRISGWCLAFGGCFYCM